MHDAEFQVWARLVHKLEQNVKAGEKRKGGHALHML